MDPQNKTSSYHFDVSFFFPRRTNKTNFLNSLILPLLRAFSWNYKYLGEISWLMFRRYVSHLDFLSVASIPCSKSSPSQG